MVEPSNLQCSETDRQEESLQVGEHLLGEGETGHEGGIVHQLGDLPTRRNAPTGTGRLAVVLGGFDY